MNNNSPMVCNAHNAYQLCNTYGYERFLKDREAGPLDPLLQISWRRTVIFNCSMNNPKPLPHKLMNKGS